MKTRLLLLCAVFVICVAQQANAQSQWKELTLYGSSHLNENVATTTAGPLTKDKADNIYAALGRGMFKWNGSSWTELGSDASGLNAYSISSVITDGNGSVYVACKFIDRTPSYQVVKWDGNEWSELGSGNTDLNADGGIESISVDKQGNVYAAGEFKNGTGNAYVAKWNGAFWSELGNDVGTGSLPVTSIITSIATDSSGNVYATGVSFQVEKWDGAEWSKVGNINTEDNLNNLVVDSKNNIYVNGLYVYEWKGAEWTQLGTGNNAIVNPNTLALDAKDSLYESSRQFHVQKWNGTEWVQIGTGSNGNVEASFLTIDKAGNIYTATDQINSQTFVRNYSYIAKWNGNTWAEAGPVNSAFNPTAPLFSPEITSTANDKAGNVYVAGNFTDTLGKEYVAKWNGSNWSELGSGANALNANGEIYTIAADGEGNVYAAGGFKNGSVRRYVAKWNGTNWAELGGGTIGALFANGDILSIEVDNKGNVYAAGLFTNTSGYYYVAKWNGTAWAELGSGASALNANSTIRSICLDLKGNVYVAGEFENTNGHYVAKWDGSTWSQLAGSEDLNFFSGTITAITSDSSGNIYSTNGYTINSVAKWNGSAWSTLGNNLNSYINSIKTDNSGNVYAAGDIVDDSERVTVQKWNGTSWTKLGYGIGLPNNGGYEINSLSIDELKGSIYAAGTIENSRYYTYVAYYPTNGIILPLSFISFTAQKQNNTAQLNWKTANEINTSYFNIQRSEDGVHFTTVGKVTANGNGDLQKEYSYADNLSALQAGAIYYRLQTIDKDGKAIYSNITSIVIDKNNTHIVIYPNPAHRFFVVDHLSLENTTYIAVKDLAGRTLLAQQATGTAKQTINISSLAKGMYVVSITTNNHTETKKLVVE